MTSEKEALIAEIQHYCCQIEEERKSKLALIEEHQRIQLEMKEEITEALFKLEAVYILISSIGPYSKIISGRGR